MGEAGADRPDPQLTDIEVSVLQLMAEGATGRTIASQLGLSIDEVRTVSDALLVKMAGIQDGHMDEAELLAHLRSVHGYRRRRSPKFEELRRRHLFAHIMRTRAGEADPDAVVDREHSI